MVTITANKNNVVDVYYVAGQSNAGGTAQPADITGDNIKYKDFSDSFIWFNQDYTSQEFNLESLKIAVNSKPGYVAYAFGFDQSMVWNLARYGNNNSVIVKLGIGGTGLDDMYTPNWMPTTANSLYDGLINSKTTLQVYLENLGYTVNHKMLLWVQGEQDSTSSTAISNYEVNQTVLFNAIRTDIKADLPIVDLKISDQVTPPYTYAGINQAKDNVAASLSNIYQLDFSDLPLRPEADNPSEYVHYYADSYCVGGERIFELIKDF